MPFAVLSSDVPVCYTLPFDIVLQVTVITRERVLPEDENEGINFVDKRHASSSSAGEAPEQAPAASQLYASGLDEADTADLGIDPLDPMAHLPHLGVMQRLLMSVDILQQGAWIGLGLVSDPATNEVKKNLDDARVAIDAVEALCKIVIPLVEPQMAVEIRNLLKDLHVNFVNQSTSSATAP